MVLNVTRPRTGLLFLVVVPVALTTGERLPNFRESFASAREPVWHPSLGMSRPRHAPADPSTPRSAADRGRRTNDRVDRARPVGGPARGRARPAIPPAPRRGAVRHRRRTGREARGPLGPPLRRPGEPPGQPANGARPGSGRRPRPLA